MSLLTTRAQQDGGVAGPLLFIQRNPCKPLTELERGKQGTWPGRETGLWHTKMSAVFWNLLVAISLGNSSQQNPIYMFSCSVFIRNLQFIYKHSSLLNVNYHPCVSYSSTKETNTKTNSHKQRIVIRTMSKTGATGVVISAPFARNEIPQGTWLWLA